MNRLSVQLKEKTLVRHQELEKKLVGKMRSMKSANDYIALLQLFYAYFGGLEGLVSPYVNAEILPDFPNRRKAGLLAADLTTLGAKELALADEENLPEIGDTATAFGALYVMEGSTLGGQFIKKMISKQLGTSENFATSFFNGYGEQTQQMWSAFQQALEDYGSVKTDERIIRSADQTFQKFSEWFDRHELSGIENQKVDPSPGLLSTPI